MRCPSCGSGHQTEFMAEINVHFSGLQNLDRPGVLVFPRVMICLDCGFSRFNTPQAELVELTIGTSTETSTPRNATISTTGQGLLGSQSGLARRTA
jgi:hypothetical protein